MRHTVIVTIVVIGLMAAPRLAFGQATDRDSVLATVRAFHHALVSGDSVAALKQLAPDLQVLESGDLETLDHYRSNHLGADMTFSRAVPSQLTDSSVVVSGDVAWVVGMSKSIGMYEKRAINSVGAELMVLSRTSEGWRIRAIHWSSRNIRKP